MIVVGTGLAGASAAATLAELGYRVRCLCFQDSPRRAHSVAAQGGINAAKNYQNDGDSVERLFHDTLEGRRLPLARGQRLPAGRAVARIIDQAWRRACRSRASTAASSPTARSAARWCRAPSTRAARPASSSCSAPTRRSCKEVAAGGVTLLPRREMLDLVVVDGRARGIVARDLVTRRARGAPRRRGGARDRRLRQRLLPLDQRARARNATAIWRAYRRGAAFANPASCSSIPPACRRRASRQAKLTLMSESLRNDGASGCRARPGDARRAATPSPRPSATTSSSARYPRYGNLAPRDLASRAAKAVCDEGRGVGPGGRGVYLDFAEARRPARRGGAARALRQPLRDVRGHHRRRSAARADAHLPRRALHDGRAVGRLRPHDARCPGSSSIGEANFSDHGANRLGASALMQGLADGYFIAAAHGGGLPRRRAPARAVRTTRPRCAPRWRRCAARDRSAAREQRPAPAGDFHRALGPRAVGRLRAGAHGRAGSRARLREIAALSRGVLGTSCACPAAAAS